MGPVRAWSTSTLRPYNNLVRVIDCDGTVLAGTYRKSHIPDAPGYQEKFYFSPGDSGFRVWGSKLGVRIGVAVCWEGTAY